MKIETVQQVLASIREAESVSIRGRLAESFPDVDFENKVVGLQGWTIVEFVRLYERCISQLSQVLVQEDISWLSNEFYVKYIDGERGSGLAIRLQTLLQHVESKDWGKATQTIQWLIEYALHHGFWHNSVLAVQTVDESKLASQQRTLAYLTLKASEAQSKHRLETAKLIELQGEVMSLSTEQENGIEDT